MSLWSIEDKLEDRERKLMNKVKWLKEDLTNDVVFAKQNNQKMSIIQQKLNRLNNFIEIFNGLDRDRVHYEESFYEIVFRLERRTREFEKLFEKFYLIFEMIGVDREDVKYYLNKSEHYLKQLHSNTASCYPFKINIPIQKLVIEKDLVHSEYDMYQFLQGINSEKVANEVIDEYMRLKKKFGNTVSE